MYGVSIVTSITASFVHSAEVNAQWGCSVRPTVVFISVTTQHDSLSFGTGSLGENSARFSFGFSV